MNEEEKRKYEAFQYWIQTNTEKGVTTIPDNLCLFVVNLIRSLQKDNEELRKFILEGVTIEKSPYQNYQLDFLRENFIPIQRIEKLIEELKQDDINMTRKYKEKKNITGELLGIDKVRVRAYREKTREINEKLHKLLSD